MTLKSIAEIRSAAKQCAELVDPQIARDLQLKLCDVLREQNASAPNGVMALLATAIDCVERNTGFDMQNSGRVCAQLLFQEPGDQSS